MVFDAIVRIALVHYVAATVEHVTGMLVLVDGTFYQNRINVNAKNDNLFFHSIAQEFVEQLCEIAGIATHVQY